MVLGKALRDEKDKRNIPQQLTQHPWAEHNEDDWAVSPIVAGWSTFKDNLLDTEQLL